MRDPARIRKFCNQLATLWESRCPDWRFGQLIMNTFCLPGNPEVFYMEDSEIMSAIEKFFKEV